MEFTVEMLVFVIDQFESMRPIAIHVSVPVWYASIWEQEHHLMRRFRSQWNKVPKHVFVFQMGLWISLLCMQKARKLIYKKTKII